MKTNLKLSVIIGFILIIFSNSSFAQSNMDWWISLSPAWKKVFQTQELKGKDITPNEEQLERIVEITHIDCSYNEEIINLKPLSKLIYLVEIRCEHTNIESLEGIENLTNLKSIDCSDNDNINSLKPLSNNINLTEIDCSNTMIKDLTPLGGLDNLKKLDVHYCTVNNLEQIKNLNNLEILDVSQNLPLYYIKGIEELKNLLELNISETKVKDLSPLKNLNKLEVLNISNTPVETLRELGKLTQLQEIDFSNTNISSVSFDYLYGHLSFTILRARNIDITEKEIKSFEDFYKRKNTNAILIITPKEN